MKIMYHLEKGPRNLSINTNRGKGDYIALIKVMHISNQKTKT